MERAMVKIGIIGDFDAGRVSHAATNTAIEHAAAKLTVKTNVAWIPTSSLLNNDSLKQLKKYDGIWASSGSPYQSTEGAIRGIQAARESGKPFIGT